MKILRLTKRQYEELRIAFMQGAECYLQHLDDSAFDFDGNVTNKKYAKEYEAYVKMLKKLEIKLNCKVT